MQDYQSLHVHVAVTICATLVNTQTYTQLLTGYTISSAELKTNNQKKNYINSASVV